ncbi:nucleotide exchange factor GrpE [Teredinibacter haidensis]|uniref:nucleotide exchange factor GrpE n=1 Tax=Teredinibacter haidensis TaxID=2731755 RepID=UPI00094890B5|nr:nucleotide exchange factor GrpE [Teredinibacter haidensis]
MSNSDQPQNDPKENLTEEQLNQEPEKVEESADETSTEEGFDDSASQLEQLQAELTEAKEQALRVAAELQNVRRRAELDVEKAHKFGLEKFVSDMLPVADNLMRAVEASVAEGAELASVTEGVELTLKSLTDALQRHKVEQVNPEGEPFNPELHQAMTAVPQPDVEPNTVINVYQVGYTLNGRLVRPAMVVVSKAE